MVVHEKKISAGCSQYTAGLGKYSTGGYGHIWVYRVKSENDLLLTCSAVVWVAALYALVTVGVGALAAAIFTAGAVLTGWVVVTGAAGDITGPYILTQDLHQLWVIGICRRKLQGH